MVPFGVRALESGVEVDGVWISRPNTPASSLPASPALSATVFQQVAPHLDSSSGRLSTASNITNAELSQLAHEHADMDRPSNSSSAIRSPFDRPVRKHEPPPTSDHQQRGRPTYQPRRSSGLRYSNSFDPEAPESLSTLDNESMMTRKDGKRPEGKHSLSLTYSMYMLTSHSEGSDSDTDDRRPSFTWSATSSNSDSRNSGDRPASKASSNGFLHPEYHNPPRNRINASYELYDVGPTSEPNSHTDERRLLTSFESHDGRPVIHSPIGGRAFEGNFSFERLNDTSNPFATPTDSPREDRASGFHEDDDITDQHARLMDDNEIAYDQNHAQPLQPFDGNRRLRRSQVIRKINSGFEILRPGTLNAYRDNIEQSEDLGEAPKQESKKLQKRGRASSKSSYTLER